MATIRWGTDVGADVVVPWVGNSVLDAARYIGAGGADDDVALAWNVHPADANTVGVWRMDEALWDGTAGEVIDASGNGHHGQAVNGATTTAGWMGRAGDFRADNYAYASLAPFPSTLTAHTIECWWYAATDVLAWSHLWGAWTNSTAQIRGEKRNVFNFQAYSVDRLECPAPTLGQWVHIALSAEAGGAMRGYFNGVQQVVGTAGTTMRNETLIAGGFRVADAFGRPIIDDLRFSNVARYGAGGFTVSRYPASGTVVAVTPLTLPRTVNAISWAATTGAEIGSIYRVHVNTGTDAAPVWTQVGGDNPTSPITSIGLATTAADLVRVTLTPRDDTLKSETPVLDWLEVDWAAVGGARAQYPRLSYGHLIGG